jgi:hypothetical protein
MTEDTSIEQMVALGFVEESKQFRGRWKLTDKGRAAFEDFVRNNPDLAAAEFPEWVKIEWVH